MDNKGFKTAGETKKKGSGKKVKKLLFLPAPKEQVREVLDKKKVEQSKVDLTPPRRLPPIYAGHSLKTRGREFKAKERDWGLRAKSLGRLGMVRVLLQGVQ